ncbi:MAG: globin [Pseudomonadales bacterium]
MTDSELILASLERCGETGVDITPAVYALFFEPCPNAHELMGHSDEHMQGRMLEQVLDLFFSDEHMDAGGYLDWELDNHLVGYRVAGDMYVHFFHALMQTVKQTVGDGWTVEMEQAWQSKIASIMAHVEAHPAVAG